MDESPTAGHRPGLDLPLPSPRPSYDDLLREVQHLTDANRAQAEVITALIDTAEQQERDLSTRLGTQLVVERRTARLHHSERALRSVIEALDGALCIVGRDGTVLDANRRWPAPAGSDFFDWCRATPDLFHLLTDVADLVREVLDAEPDELGDRPRSVKGQIGAGDARRWVVLRVHPIRDHHLARAVVTLIDITDGMRTQEDLRRATEEAQRLALVALATDNAVVITEPDGTIEWVNGPFVSHTGYELDEAVGHRRSDLIHPSCLETPEFQEFLARVELGHGADGEFPMVSRTGDAYWASVEVRPVHEEGRVSHLVWIEQDVTARRDTQRRLSQATQDAETLASALTQEKTLLSGVISAIPQLVYWKDQLGRYAGCNTAYLAFRGLTTDTQILGLDESGVAHDDPLRATLDDLESRVISTGEPVVNHKVDVADSTGQNRSLLLSVLPLDVTARDGARGVIGVGADITHARDLERQLAQANRLESIGQLASGIAHEINTPIQFVADNTQFVAESTTEMLSALSVIHDAATRQAAEAGGGDDALRALTCSALEQLDLDFLREEVPNALRDNREGLHRVAQIVRAMKDYAHPGTSLGDVDINKAIETTIQVCRNEWKYVAQVNLDLAPDAGLVPAYEGELKQVLLNMMVNAAQAITDDPRRRSDSPLGQINITTRRTGTEFVITIADDGPGMTAQVRDSAFNPFFTTKQVGKGTGQGLSLAHAVIVTKHRGRIDLTTSPGEGATFTMRLPLEQTASPEGPRADDQRHGNTPTGGPE